MRVASVVVSAWSSSTISVAPFFAIKRSDHVRVREVLRDFCSDFGRRFLRVTSLQKILWCPSSARRQRSGLPPRARAPLSMWSCRRSRTRAGVCRLLSASRICDAVAVEAEQLGEGQRRRRREAHGHLGRRELVAVGVGLVRQFDTLGGLECESGSFQCFVTGSARSAGRSSGS